MGKNPKENDFLTHPDAFEQIFDFYNFDFYTFKNNTFESACPPPYTDTFDCTIFPFLDELYVATDRTDPSIPISI